MQGSCRRLASDMTLEEEISLHPSQQKFYGHQWPEDVDTVAAKTTILVSWIDPPVS